MNGLNAHEWIRATIVADVFHWGVVGVLALAVFLVQRWVKRRRARASWRREDFPGSFGPIAPAFHVPEPSCTCSTCGRVHWPTPSAEEQRAWQDYMDANDLRVPMPLGMRRGPIRPGPRVVGPPTKKG